MPIIAYFIIFCLLVFFGGLFIFFLAWLGPWFVLLLLIVCGLFYFGSAIKRM